MRRACREHSEQVACDNKWRAVPSTEKMMGWEEDRREHLTRQATLSEETRTNVRHGHTAVPFGAFGKVYECVRFVATFQGFVWRH